MESRKGQETTSFDVSLEFISSSQTQELPGQGNVFGQALGQFVVRLLPGGMRKIIDLVQTDSKCRNYDLSTLAKNPSKYCPELVVEKKKRRMVRWEMVCDVCGTCATVPQLAPKGDPAPPPVPCSNANAGAGCQRTMEPRICQEMDV